MKKFIAVSLAAFMLLCLFSCGKNAPVESARKLLNARAAGDIDACVELTLNPYMIKNRCAKQGITEEQVIDDAKASAANLYSGLVALYGENIKITSFEINERRDYDKEELKTLSDYLHNKRNYPEKALSAACLLKIDIDIEGDSNRDSLTRSVVMTKIDGKWYWGFDGENHPQVVRDILNGKEIY